MSNEKLPGGASVDHLYQNARYQAEGVPYRRPDPIATLQAEVAELKTQVAGLSASLATITAALNAERDRRQPTRAGALPPFVRSGPCRKCGVTNVRVLMQRGMNEPAWENQDAVKWKYEPAVPRFFFIPPTPERILRECQACHAKYYESPLDVIVTPSGDAVAPPPRGT